MKIRKLKCSLRVLILWLDSFNCARMHIKHCFLSQTSVDKILSRDITYITQIYIRFSSMN